MGIGPAAGISRATDYPQMRGSCSLLALYSLFSPPIAHARKIGVTERARGTPPAER